MSNSINICLYNAQSYVNKFFSINQFIQDNKIDIMCLNETFLNDKITNINLIHNFTILRNDRKEKRGGGVAFIINKRINYTLLKSKSTHDYEYLAIEIISSNEKITLLNINTHPQSKTNYNFIEKIVKSTTNKIICVGDMNATNIAWYCNSTNKRGKFLESICDKNNLNIVNQNRPTSRKSTNIIDLVLCSEMLIHRISDMVVDLTFDPSDHWPVWFKLIFSPGKSMIKKINWDLLKSDLESQFKDKIDVILSKEEFEIKASNFSKTITDCLDNNTCEVEKTSHIINIPTYLFNLIKVKKKLKRVFTKTHDPEISNMINNISNKIKRHNKRLMQEKWNNHCAFLAKSKPSEQVYWRIIKQVEAGNIPNSTNILPNTPIAKDKAKILADFYEDVFMNDFFDRNFENIFDPGEQYNEITLATM
jgi:exonuclease III